MLRSTEALRPLEFDEFAGPGSTGSNSLLSAGVSWGVGRQRAADRISPSRAVHARKTKSVARFVGGLFPPELGPELSCGRSAAWCSRRSRSRWSDRAGNRARFAARAAGDAPAGRGSLARSARHTAWALRWVAYGLARLGPQPRPGHPGADLGADFRGAQSASVPFRVR